MNIPVPICFFLKNNSFSSSIFKIRLLNDSSLEQSFLVNHSVWKFKAYWGSIFYNVHPLLHISMYYLDHIYLNKNPPLDSPRSKKKIKNEPKFELVVNLNWIWIELRETHSDHLWLIFSSQKLDVFLIKIELSCTHDNLSLIVQKQELGKL